MYCKVYDKHLKTICISTDEVTQGLSWTAALYATLWDLADTNTVYTGHVAYMNNSSIMGMILTEEEKVYYSIKIDGFIDKYYSKLSDLETRLVIFADTHPWEGDDMIGGAYDTTTAVVVSQSPDALLRNVVF